MPLCDLPAHICTCLVFTQLPDVQMRTVCMPAALVHCCVLLAVLQVQDTAVQLRRVRQTNFLYWLLCSCCRALSCTCRIADDDNLVLERCEQEDEEGSEDDWEEQQQQQEEEEE
jgi:hypothetical protein